jgi:predicted aspartyl protease
VLEFPLPASCLFFPHLLPPFNNLFLHLQFFAIGSIYQEPRLMIIPAYAILSQAKMLLIEKIQETKTSHQRKGKHSVHKIKPNKPLNRNQKYCKIHGKCNHSSSQCDMIQKQHEEYKSTTNNKNQNKKKTLTTWSIIRDHIHAKSRNKNSSLTANQTNDTSDSESEINHSEEVFHLQDPETKIETVCTEIYVYTTSPDSQHTYLLGLLDTGATGFFIKQSVLKTIQHKIQPVDVQVKGRYSQSHITHIASFKIKLPDFCNHKTIMVQAYVENKVVGHHDIILGIRFIQQLGLVFDFKRNTVSWDELTNPLRQLGSFTSSEAYNNSYDDTSTPKIVQTAVKRMERRITSNEYNDHNYRSMVLKCTHLSVSQQDDLLELFARYTLLFDGTLGKIPNVKVHLELKPNSKPYCARAYKIPHHILEVVRKEVEECRIGVLQADIHSEWGAPCLFRAKKRW